MRPMPRRFSKSRSSFSRKRAGLVSSTRAGISFSGGWQVGDLPHFSLLDRQQLLRTAVAVFRIGDHTCRGHLVAFLEAHQAHALRRAAHLADGRGLDANDLAILDRKST